MKLPVILSALVLGLSVQFASAYDIPGARPIDKLAEEQAKAKSGKKLVTLVYQGADTRCPHCATAAENGVKAVRSSTEMVLITEAQVKDKALVGKLPKAAQEVLQRQPTNAWVSFTVFDADMTKVIASGDRSNLETDKKAIREFGDKVRDARKELK